jgi:hypothetical protein
MSMRQREEVQELLRRMNRCPPVPSATGPKLPFTRRVVDAKDEQAESFCLHHGFVPFGDMPGTLVLPLPKRT